MDAASTPVIVLGYGAAAHSAISALRDDGYTGSIVVVSDVGRDSYSPVLTSYYVGGRIDVNECCPWSEDEYADRVDCVIDQARVVSIVPADHQVFFDDESRLRYAKLLIATGAHPVAPGFPNGPVTPHTLRTFQDAVRLRRALTSASCESVLVSGTSMVGLKAVEACLDRGMRTTLLGRSAHILRATAHPLVATRFERLLEERGVTLRLEQEIEDVEDAGHCGEAGEVGESGEGCRDNATGNLSGEHGGCAVHFSNGDVERFDEIVLAQGVKPNLGFVDPRSMDLREGLVVDEFMRTSAPDVFAAGDVAQATDLSTGEKRIIGLWAHAVQQGRCAGSAMAAELAGRPPARPYPGSLPSNTIHVRDVLFASAGSVAEGNARRIDVHETSDELVLFVYEMRGEIQELVGFNVLSIAVDAKHQGGFIDRIGAYRRAIVNSYL